MINDKLYMFAIMSNGNEAEPRFIVLDDVDNIREHHDYRYACEVYNSKVSCEDDNKLKMHRDGLIANPRIYIGGSYEAISACGDDIPCVPNMEMYLALSIALRKIGMVYNKKRHRVEFRNGMREKTVKRKRRMWYVEKRRGA